ncbi:unnamed protein product [Effrenium voratum]|nr:unnamed protein product [Effrenium voratum]
MSVGLKAVRLTTLLRNFGLCPVEVSKQEGKSAILSLRAAYRERAKVHHPDLMPQEKKAEAEVHFSKLSTEFHEAVKLIEAGVRPVMAGKIAQAGHYPGGTPAFRTGEVWQRNKTFKHSEPEQFDTYTRVKGHLIVWSSLFVFLTLMREFLVGFAGSTWAYKSPSNINPFWVRRYGAGPAQGKDEEDAPPPDAQGAKSARQKSDSAAKDRGVPTFYQKRGISNVRKNYSPRGHGPSL